MSSSTILYKFRSGTTFEALPLPGTAARLFDVKKAIVTAKKLDQGSMEFDLSIKDATTNEPYTDEGMILPRGTRLIVQRLPAGKGQGILARIARDPYGGGGGGAPAGGAAPSNFYTIESKANDDEEFVNNDDDAELAALRAATDTGQVGRMARPGGAPFRPPPRTGGAAPLKARPNADPELREAAPKKRATGIPRTFLSLKAEQDEDATLLQPNRIGFEELVQRGGGLSETAATKRDLEYALKLTASVIPDYLACAICGKVVKDAMILPWDPEGRTTCETCIRDALTQNGFRCPLTGMEGVSPDDLLPNLALRKAADQFVKGVMEKMEEVEKQQIVDDEEEDEAEEEALNDLSKKEVLEGDSGEKGVLVSRKSITNVAPVKEEDVDFGGDVFAIDEPVPEPPAAPADPVTETKETTPTVVKKEEEAKATAVKVEEPVVAPAKVEEAPVSRRERRRGPPAGYSMGPAGGAVSAVARPREDDRRRADDYRGGDDYRDYRGADRNGGGDYRGADRNGDYRGDNYRGEAESTHSGDRGSDGYRGGGENYRGGDRGDGYRGGGEDYRGGGDGYRGGGRRSDVRRSFTHLNIRSHWTLHSCFVCSTIPIRIAAATSVLETSPMIAVATKTVVTTAAAIVVVAEVAVDTTMIGPTAVVAVAVEATEAEVDVATNHKLPLLLQPRWPYRIQPQSWYLSVWTDIHGYL